MWSSDFTMILFLRKHCIYSNGTGFILFDPPVIPPFHLSDNQQERGEVNPHRVNLFRTFHNLEPTFAFSFMSINYASSTS